MNNMAFTFSEILDWVERLTGACVNFTEIIDVTCQVPGLSLPQRQQYHNRPFCDFAKRHTRRICLANKTRSKEVAATLQRPFAGFCPRGIWDLAVPVHFQDQLIGIFYLGSLAGDDAPVLQDGTTFPGSLRRKTPELVAQLNHYGEHLRDFVLLVLERWVADGNQLSKHKPVSHYVDAVEMAISQEYDRPISLAELADRLHVHQNHLGQLIKRETGSSFRDLLRTFRIEKAKALLALGKCVTDTAYEVGFNDGNYFSTVFKQVTGMTPTAYRSSIDGR